MSLDIIAYDPKETKARKNKFKAKYGISYDKFDDEMIKPRKDMFCYYLHPELLESDIKEYEEMDDDAELIADVDEVDSFHIGYGQFNFLRKELGEKKAGKWAEEINSFLKFWKESADKKLQWEFC